MCSCYNEAEELKCENSSGKRQITDCYQFVCENNGHACKRPEDAYVCRESIYEKEAEIE